MMQANLSNGSILAIAILLLCGVHVFASPFFGSTGTTTGSTGPDMTSSQPPHIMSPDEFASRVNSLSQTVNSTLAQQASSALPKTNVDQNTSTVSTSTTSAPPSPLPNKAPPAQQQPHNTHAPSPLSNLATPPPPVEETTTVTAPTT